MELIVAKNKFKIEKHLSWQSILIMAWINQDL